MSGVATHGSIHCQLSEGPGSRAAEGTSQVVQNLAQAIDVQIAEAQGDWQQRCEYVAYQAGIQVEPTAVPVMAIAAMQVQSGRLMQVDLATPRDGQTGPHFLCQDHSLRSGGAPPDRFAPAGLRRSFPSDTLCGQRGPGWPALVVPAPCPGPASLCPLQLVARTWWHLHLAVPCPPPLLPGLLRWLALWAPQSPPSLALHSRLATVCHRRPFFSGLPPPLAAHVTPLVAPLCGLQAPFTSAILPCLLGLARRRPLRSLLSNLSLSCAAARFLTSSCPVVPNVSSTVFSCSCQDVERRLSLKSQLFPLISVKGVVLEIEVSERNGLLFACWVFVDSSLFRHDVYIDNSFNAA